MAEFKDFFVMFIVIGLFIFVFISFSINLSSENNAQTNLNQNPALNKMFGNISTTLNNTANEANAANKGFGEETKKPIISAFGFIFKSILSAGKVFMSSIINIFSYILSFAQETLHIPAIITGTILAVITGVLIFAVVKAIRGE